MYENAPFYTGYRDPSTGPVVCEALEGLNVCRVTKFESWKSPLLDPPLLFQVGQTGIPPVKSILLEFGTRNV